MRYFARLSVIIGTALLLMLLTVAPPDADPICGDVNSDGLGPNIADICYLVNYLFHGTPSIPNYRPAEIDGDYGVSVADLTRLVNSIFAGGPAPDCVPVGAIDDGYGCLADSLPTRELPELRATGTLELEVVGNDLFVRHIDAIANCCPAFFFDYYVEPGAILVVEWDSLYLCDCVCRFNLESVVPDLEPGDYAVTVLGVCTYPYGAECDTVGVGQVSVVFKSEP